MRWILQNLMILILACTLSVAQDEDIDFSEMSLEDLLNVEVTVASKSEETVDDAPSSVTVFSRAEIQNMGITNIYDLLNYVPGFQVTLDVQNGQVQSIAPRGRGTALDNSFDVLFLIDGQRINNSHTGGATLFNRLITTANVKQVEVIRGPGSALYGSNAFLGVVNIVTADDLSELSFGAGENGLWEANASYSQNFGEDGNFYIFAGGFADDGQEYATSNPFDPETQDPREGRDFYSSFRYKGFSASVRYQERSFEDFYQFDAQGDGFNFDDTDSLSVNAKMVAVKNDRLEVSVSAGFITQSWQAVLLAIPAGVDTGAGPLPGPFLVGPDYENEDQKLAVDFSYQVNDRNSLSGGVVYRETENAKNQALTTYADRIPIAPFYLGELTENQLPVDVALQQDRTIYGAYLQDKIKIRENLSLILGGRFDDYSDFGNTFNPRGGLIFSGASDYKLKLLYGSAFRAPSFVDLYSEVADELMPNPDLQPEEVQTIEAAYIQKFAKGRFGATFFSSEIENIIIFLINDGVQTPINSGSADFSGGELELSYGITNNLIFRAALTSIFDGASANTAEEYGALSFNYNNAGWNVNLNGIFRGEIDALPQQDAYWVANFKTSYRFNNRFSVYAKANNVFDEDYLTYGNTVPGGAVPNRGRFASAGIVFKY